MTTEEIETMLRKQTPRPVPRAWRDQILEGATSPRTPVGAWLWPHPAAWGAIAAIWLMVFALRANTDAMGGPVPRLNLPPQVAEQALREHLELIAAANLPVPEPPPNPEITIRPLGMRMNLSKFVG